MLTEKKVTAKIIAYLKTVPGLWWFKVHGGPMQQAGIPDLCVVHAGRAIFLEVKHPGGKPTPLQIAMMERIEAAGGVAAVVQSTEDVVEVLK